LLLTNAAAQFAGAGGIFGERRLSPAARRDPKLLPVSRAAEIRLDTESLQRGFLGRLREERGHCSMARVPMIAEEDAKRANDRAQIMAWRRLRTRRFYPGLICIGPGGSQ
jgi:hypothetical protein